MAERPPRELAERSAPPARRSAGGAADRRWAGDARFAACCGAGFAVLAALLDVAAAGLPPERAALWLPAGAVVTAILLPPRVSAGDGWLTVRSVARRRRVRTTELVAARLTGAVALQLVLRDAAGRRVEFDPRVLSANPLLWHELDSGILASRRAGLLPAGPDDLAALRAGIDTDGARAVFRASGLR